MIISDTNASNCSLKQQSAAIKTSIFEGSVVHLRLKGKKDPKPHWDGLWSWLLEPFWTRILYFLHCGIASLCSNTTSLSLARRTHALCKNKVPYRAQSQPIPPSLEQTHPIAAGSVWSEVLLLHVYDNWLWNHDFCVKCLVAFSSNSKIVHLKS